MVNVFRHRANKIVGILEKCSGIKCTYPEGSVYIWVDCRKITDNDIELSDRLLYNAKVATVPGSCFGEAGKGFLRISLGAEEELIEKAANSIVNELRKDGKE